MKIEDQHYNCSLEDVLDELISQMQLNELPYLKKGYKRSNDSLQVQCPFHGNGQEEHPSFGIRRSDGMGHCFACGKVCELPEFITRVFDKSDILSEFGRRWLRKNFMSVAVEERKDVDLDFQRDRGSRFNRKSDTVPDNFVDDETLDKYRYYHPYWKKRGIVDEDIIELFDLGYDRETQSITFPVRDTAGHCLFVARRNVHTKFFNYPKGVQKPLYGLYEFYKDRELGGVDELDGDPRSILVCESMIDCILLWQEGHYAVALNGLGNELQMKQLRELPCRELILATDNDEAGDKARDRIKKAVTNKLISEIIFPSTIKDIGECTNDQLHNIIDWKFF